MRRYPVFSVLTLLVSLLAVSCDSRGSAGLRYDFGDIIDIVLTPDSTVRRAGCFTDAGSWMGFTLPQRDSRINGFCGPFSIEHRLWMAQAAVTVGFAGDEGVMQPDSLTYFPGEVFMSSSSEAGRMEQRMVFADRTTALLAVTGDSDAGFVFAGKGWNSRVRLGMRENTVVAEHPSGETVLLTFSPGTEVSCSGDNYSARTAEGCRNTWVAVSFCYEGDDVEGLCVSPRADYLVYVASKRHGLCEVNTMTGKVKMLHAISADSRPVGLDIGGKDLWLSTTSGLVRYDIAVGSCSVLRQDSNDRFSLSDDYVNCVLIDDMDGLWVGTAYHGVNYHGVHQDLFGKFYRTDDGESLEGSEVCDFAQDGDGNVWIAISARFAKNITTNNTTKQNS